MKHPLPVTLSESERASPQTFILAGKANARTFTRARVLLKAAECWIDQDICAVFDISRNTSIVGGETQCSALYYFVALYLQRRS